MSQRKLLLISFLLISILTGALCVLFKQPLALGPVPYSTADILVFVLLGGFLSYGLVYLTLPLLRYGRSFLKFPATEEGYYILSTLFVLQPVTMITGYLESAMSRHQTADWLYYYKGVTNSHLWIIAGNMVAATIASLYAKKQIRKMEEDKTHQQIHRLRN